jgi:hypothetical protein
VVAVALSTPQTILVGIDEAGYGPTLGPLTVGMSVFAVPAAEAGQPNVPDLWTTLASGVCREPGRGGKPDAKGRIAIADSKQLKLSSSVKTTHPLVHLERGVLTALMCAGHEVLPDDGTMTDGRLFAALGAQMPSEAWYTGEIALPIAHGAAGGGSLRIAANQFDRALRAAKVEILAMKCRVMGEREFNDLAINHGGKGATTGKALCEHLRFVWDRWGAAHEGKTSLGIVCDRQGGRAAYTGLLQRALPGTTITVVEESETRSRYSVEGVNAHGHACKAGIAFLVEAEQHHLPVALASMIAKFSRELAMERFNRYWSQRAAGQCELKPTAGYALDAGRWLKEAREVYSMAEKEWLVRKA